VQRDRRAGATGVHGTGPGPARGWRMAVRGGLPLGIRPRLVRPAAASGARSEPLSGDRGRSHGRRGTGAISFAQLRCGRRKRAARLRAGHRGAGAGAAAGPAGSPNGEDGAALRARRARAR
jgi:hypothetical protein